MIKQHQDEEIVRASARSRMLDAAQDLFYQRGYRAVGIDEIIARSEVAKATLYAHFGSKDRLVAAYLQRHSDRFQIFLNEEVTKAQGGPAEKLDGAFAVVERGCANPSFRGCPFINFAVEFPDRSTPGWEVCFSHRAWLHQFIAELAREGGAVDPQLLAKQWCLLYDTAMVGSMFDGGYSAEVAREMARTLVNAALGRDTPAADAMECDDSSVATN